MARLTESTPSDETLAEVLHARRLLDEFLNLSVDGKNDGGFEVSTSELVLDSLDDLDGVFVLNFSTVGTCERKEDREGQLRVEGRARTEGTRLTPQQLVLLCSSTVPSSESSSILIEFYMRAKS